LSTNTDAPFSSASLIAALAAAVESSEPSVGTRIFLNRAKDGAGDARETRRQTHLRRGHAGGH
jgi:hypothetical protein